MLSDQWTEQDFLKLTDCRYRCFSYAYTGYDSPLKAPRHIAAMDWCIQNGVHVFMDSGAHSFHNFRYRRKGFAAKLSREEVAKQVDIVTKQFGQGFLNYIKWCYSHDRYFDFYVTFDADRDAPFCWDITNEYFKKGIYPVPVYHGDSPLVWVKKYIDQGHKLIGVGIDRRGKSSATAVRRYYDSVISLCEKHGVKCHGFAVTGDLMFQFPWYSVDSTTWIKAAAYGKLLDIIPEKQRVALIHVSERALGQGYGTVEGLSPSVRKYLRDMTESKGFDFDKLRKDFYYRTYYNAKVMMDAVAAHSKRLSNSEWRSWKSVLA